MRILFRTGEIITLNLLKRFLHLRPRPRRVIDEGRPAVVVLGATVEIDAEVDDAAAAEAFAAGVGDAAVVERGLRGAGVVVVEVWAEESGCVAVVGLVEVFARGLGAGFDEEDGGVRGGVREAVREEAAGCASWWSVLDTRSKVWS